ncbi:MAG: alcohol dehydrogenase catalytic domain-containing protein [Gammaproteobacteria bacterium]|nr:alcohol dehydrogenase catalytic domain-containing protein [Gammaproteobacteria bacterium]
MTTPHQQYQQADGPLPEQNWTWNMYGAGVESIGRENAPEAFGVPEPGDEQILVRVDAVGLCFSDVKLITQGGAHPKLYNRDLKIEPTRLGHEATLTVIKVGEKLKAQFKPGERYAMQPDIYQNGKSTAYGYTVPGGLIQYHLIGPEVLETDTGSCLLKVSERMGFAEAALLEPWGCVWAAYTQRRRLQPKQGGSMWIVGQPGDKRSYSYSSGLDAPALIVVSDISAQLRSLLAQSGARIVERNALEVDDYAALAAEFTDGKGFDDIVVLAPRSAKKLSAIARQVARRGTMNMVGNEPLDGLVDADVGRLHYDYVAFIGNRGEDIAASYGEARNRCDLRPGGTAVFVGAGGPMGQMHAQRAIELPDGPKLVIVSDINERRLQEMESRFTPLAEANGCKVLIFNPLSADVSFHDFVLQANGGKGADDVVVCVPNAGLMEESATFMNADGMLVLFAGVPNGTLAPLEFSSVYLHNAQYTGTSGLTIEDQSQVMESALKGAIAPALSVAAIGGMRVAQEGIKAMMESRYPGKVLIFPQLLDLPLLALDELDRTMPEVAAKLGPGNSWSHEAEAALFDRCLAQAK